MANIGDDYIYGTDILDALIYLDDARDSKDLSPEEREDIEETLEGWVLFQEQAQNATADWKDETFIHDDAFVKYAEETARDLNGATMEEWPFYHIDWEAAAEALQMDYTAIEVNGDTYWVRA